MHVYLEVLCLLWAVWDMMKLFICQSSDFSVWVTILWKEFIARTALVEYCTNGWYDDETTHLAVVFRPNRGENVAISWFTIHACASWGVMSIEGCLQHDETLYLSILWNQCVDYNPLRSTDCTNSFSCVLHTWVIWWQHTHLAVVPTSLWGDHWNLVKLIHHACMCILRSHAYSGLFATWWNSLSVNPLNPACGLQSSKKYWLYE